MDASLMRLVWSVVDKTPLPQQGQLTEELSPCDRMGAVLSAIDRQPTLSPQERQQIHQYLASRQHLLKELYR